MIKTSKGWIRKEICEDGRENIDRRIERETFQRDETITKINRAKKSEAKLMSFVEDL